MTIVLPLFFAAVGFGLFARRMTGRAWAALATIIALVLAFNYFKPMDLSVDARPGPGSR